MDFEQIKKRWLYAYEAKSDELDRIEKASWWMFEFERHLERGEEGDAAYRFPETMGYVLRRYNNFLEVLPEARSISDGEVGIGSQATLDHFQQRSNFTKTRMRALLSASAFGSGCINIQPIRYTKYDRAEDKWFTSFRGLGAEFVDWRYIFPAPGYQSLHDHTGQDQCPYVFRLKTYHMDTFRAKYSDPKYNTEEVRGTTWGNPNVFGESIFAMKHEIQEGSTSQDYVTVLQYYDIENDMFSEFATGGVQIYESKKGIELSHKEFPFHQYRNIQRTDSINGMGEIELNLPYNLFREKALNLGIMDMMMQEQPAVIADGDINFNPEEHELRPGAVFNVKGLNGGRLQDHIMPFSFGAQGLTQGVFTMMQLIENSRISVTSDDTTALYSNPNQLATQTLAKMQSLNRSIDAATKQNIADAEFYMMRQCLYLIKNELSEPISEDKKVIYPLVKIKGYKTVQEKPDKGCTFVRDQDVVSKFYLNKKVSESFNPDEIEIVPAKKDEELKRDRTEKLMMMMQTVLQTVSNLASSQPQMINEVFGTMDIPQFIKNMAKNLGLEDVITEIFPVVEKAEAEINAVNLEHEQIMMGITPQIRPDEESLDEYSQHLEFMNSAFFKKHATKKIKEAMNKHLLLTLQNAGEQNAVPVADRQKGMGQNEKGIFGRGSGVVSQMGSVQGGGGGQPTNQGAGAQPNVFPSTPSNRDVQQELINRKKESLPRPDSRV